MKYQLPISDFEDLPVNNTLHGRSVYRPYDVPGHNVFKGYSTWQDNGHRGVGDSLDLFCKGRTPVYAIEDCEQIRHSNDESRLEVIYLQGANSLAVYAHINAEYTGIGRNYSKGDVVGLVRSDLNEPHLHFELWYDGKAVSGETPRQLHSKMYKWFIGEPGQQELEFRVFVAVDGKDKEVFLRENGDHRRDQNRRDQKKIYMRF
jgi:murein DD-endopeptidase MepM/ murein hydrolase activator NlpD